MSPHEAIYWFMGYVEGFDKVMPTRKQWDNIQVTLVQSLMPPNGPRVTTLPPPEDEDY